MMLKEDHQAEWEKEMKDRLVDAKWKDQLKEEIIKKIREDYKGVLQGEKGKEQEQELLAEFTAKGRKQINEKHGDIKNDITAKIKAVLEGEEIYKKMANFE